MSEENEKEDQYHKKDWHREPDRHRQTRRSTGHNYRWRGSYMITMTAAPAAPRFCSVTGTPTVPSVLLSPLGARIATLIDEIHFHVPAIRVEASVIMPDHLHLLLTVTAELRRHIGYEIGAFMGNCSRAARELCGYTEPLFPDRYHDRIIHDGRHLGAAAAYINDNPRRLLIKRAQPDLFRRYLHLQIGEREFAAYGNLFLLRDFEKIPVRIHRRWSRQELDEYTARCLDVAGRGGVLISPFIHPWEREIRDRALETGARVITLKAEGMPERFKPQGLEFRLCLEGRLLLLAPLTSTTWPRSWPHPLCPPASSVKIKRRDPGGVAALDIFNE